MNPDNDKKERRPRGASLLAPVMPPVLAERDAGTYLGRSSSWMRKRRFDDLAAIRRGERPSGPMWILVESSICYRVRDLDEWIETTAVERGACEFRGHRSASDAAAEDGGEP